MRSNPLDTLLLLIRRHNQVGEGVGLLLVSLWLIVKILWPMLTATYALGNTMSAKHATLAGLTQEVTFLTNLDATTLAEKVAALDRVLPRTKDILLYLATTEGLAKDLSLAMSGVNLSPGEVSSGSAQAPLVDGISSLDTSLSVVGSQYAVYSFLQQVEQTAPLLRVQDVAISKGQGDSLTLNVTLSMMYAGVDQTAQLTSKTALLNENEENLYQELVKMKGYGVSGDKAQLTVPVGKTNLFDPVKAQP